MRFLQVEHWAMAVVLNRMNRYLKQRGIPHIGLDKPALDARLKGRCKGQALHHGHITGNRMHPQHIQNMLVQ